MFQINLLKCVFFFFFFSIVLQSSLLDPVIVYSITQSSIKKAMQYTASLYYLQNNYLHKMILHILVIYKKVLLSAHHAKNWAKWQISSYMLKTSYLILLLYAGNSLTKFAFRIIESWGLFTAPKKIFWCTEIPRLRRSIKKISP